MSNRANILANISEAAPRKRGPAPGVPKPAGSGRKKGSRNRVTREIAEIAQKHGKAIVSGLVEAFEETTDPEVKVKIGALVLSYGYGQPVRRSEVSGPNGQPIRQETDLLDARAQRVAAAFTEVADDPDPGVKLGDDGLRGVQAVNFVLAQQERAKGKRKSAPLVSTPAPAAVIPSAAEIRTSEAPDGLGESNPPVADPGEPTAPPEGHTLAFLDSEWSIRAYPPDRLGLDPAYQVHRSGAMIRRGPFKICLELIRKQSGGTLGPWIVQAPAPQPAGPVPRDQGFARRPGFAEVQGGHANRKRRP